MNADVSAQMPLAPTWHSMTVDAVLAELQVDPKAGLTDSQVRARREAQGSNVLAESPKKSGFRRVLALLSDRMTIVLVVAAAISAIVSREWETPVVILVVIILNTALSFVQENRAENSLEALRSSTVTTSLALRDGLEREVPSPELVPGDIVFLDAGDAVPADGRILEAVRLEMAEASLTGEAEPVEKSADQIDRGDAQPADRLNMAFMNTEVTRGRAVIVVTETGMATQIGHVAESLDSAGMEKTPLQRKTDQLAGLLTVVAIVVVVIVVVLGLIRGQSWTELLLTAVSLAVATIPEGLTAVVTFTLAMGASRLARQGAIIKQLSAVETLGSTTDIATDKTGTLTLNQMTVRQFIVGKRSFRVTGEGYSVDGSILSRDGAPHALPVDGFLAMALCNDSTVRSGQITGDPTEAALVVLAEKGGVDVDGARKLHPRVAEIPFDSDYKFMATFHDQQFDIGDTTPARYRCFAKGAPGILIDRADSYLDQEGIHPLTEQNRVRLLTLIDELAGEGLRTLMIAGRRIDSELPSDQESLRDALCHLTLYAVVGILDPPRQEVGGAITVVRQAGIRVHMITGDSVVTATAIAQDLGIPGESAGASSLDEMDDARLAERAPHYGVLARVSPQHKIRFVRALQSSGAIVAMTGDGVNDAPALKQADIGIAMGITGTDVSKSAASMILTDDNFATIVTAIEVGRGVYANILKFVQFQLSTSWGFVLVFLTCSLFGVAGGAPFTALQILLVNVIMDGPPALALGVDRVEPGIMKDRPRPPREALLTRPRLARVLLLGVVMALGTVAVLVLASEWFPSDAKDPLFVTTLAFTTFVFYQVFNLLNVRSTSRSVFSILTFSNRAIWIALLAVVLVQIAVVNVDFLQDLFGTTALTAAQWCLTVGVASSVLWVDEVRKLIVRLRSASVSVQ